MTQRWGVVGTGGIAHTVMSDLLLVPEAELVGVCSRTADRAQAFAAELTVPDGVPRPTPRAYTDLAEMLPDIDVLYVATPHLVHITSALPALRSGTAVLCEKSLTGTYPEAELLVEAARESGAFLMEAVWMRFGPLHVRLRELVGQGALGQVRQVSADLSVDFPYDPGARLYDPAAGGGALLDLGPYPVSLIQSLLGDPLSVTVNGSLAANGVDDTAALLLRYPDGVSGIATCTFRALGPRNVVVVGTDGWAELTGPIHRPGALRVHRDGHQPEELTVPLEGRGYPPMLREVVARVAAGEQQSPVMPWADTLSAMRILTDALDELGVVYPDTR
jgi:predicted dehydrogenase